MAESNDQDRSKLESATVVARRRKSEWFQRLGIICLCGGFVLPVFAFCYGCIEGSPEAERKHAAELRGLTGDWLGGTLGAVANVAATLMVLAALHLQAAEFEAQKNEFEEGNRQHRRHADEVEKQNSLTRFFSIKAEFENQIKRLDARDSQRLEADLANTVRALDGDLGKNKQNLDQSRLRQCESLLGRCASREAEYQVMKEIVNMADSIIESAAVDSGNRQAMKQIVEALGREQIDEKAVAFRRQMEEVGDLIRRCNKAIGS